MKLLFIKCFAYIFSCIFSYHSIRCYICFLGEYWSNGPYLAHDHLAKKWWGRETNQASFSFKDAINQDWLGLWSLELPQELSWTSNLRSPQLSFHRSLMACCLRNSLQWGKQFGSLLTTRKSLKKSTLAYRVSSTHCKVPWEREHMASRTVCAPRLWLKIMKRSRRASLQAMSFSTRSGTP